MSWLPWGGAGGCLGLSIRWALDNQPCHGQGLSLVLRPQGLLPRETTLAEGAGAGTCQLSGRRFLGLRTRARGHRRGEAGGGGQGGSEGSVRPAASRSGSGRGRPGYYCPVLPPHRAGAAPGRLPSGPGRRRQGAVCGGGRSGLQALPASTLQEGREAEHSVPVTEASRLPGVHIRPMTLTECGGDRQTDPREPGGGRRVPEEDDTWERTPRGLAVSLRER